MSSSDPTPIHQLGQVILATENYVFFGDQVLVHRRSDTKPRFPGFLVGPGGRIDEGEDAIAAAVREIREETGLSVPPERVILRAVGIHHHLDRGEIWVNFITRTRLTQPPGQLRHSDEGLSEWLPLGQLLETEKVFPPSKYYFDHVLSNHPGILYTNIEWRNAELVHVLSQTLAPVSPTTHPAVQG